MASKLNQYTLDDPGISRQLLENKLRDLRGQWDSVEMEREKWTRVQKRAKANQLRAIAFNEGAGTQIAPQAKQQLANITQNLEEIEISIDIVQERLAALPKAEVEVDDDAAPKAPAKVT